MLIVLPASRQVRRLVVDPDMILQLTKKSAESMTASQGRGARSARSTPPYSHVDGWKSVNGRPFTPWLKSSVDVWDVELDDEIGLAGWLHSPQSDAALDFTAIAMEVRLSSPVHYVAASFQRSHAVLVVPVLAFRQSIMLRNVRPVTRHECRS